MNFYKWLILNENIEANFDSWLQNIIKYSKPIPSFLSRFYDGSIQIPELQKNIIKTVLKERNIENFNWFSFSIGYFCSKPNFFKEDLELAIKVVKKKIDSRDLLKTEIGQKGWLTIGYEAKKIVEEYIVDSQKISNRQERRTRKLGDILSGDDRYIKLVAQENDLKLYLLPSIKQDEGEIKARKRVLCKYGKGTKWCTAVPDGDYHEYYINNDIFILHKNNNPIYQFTNCDLQDNNQFMDEEDEPVVELNFDIFNFLIKNVANAIDCYDLKTTLNLNQFFDPKINNNLKNKVSGDSLAYILLSSKNWKETQNIVKNLKLNFNEKDISDFIIRINKDLTDEYKKELILDIINKNKKALKSEGIRYILNDILIFTFDIRSYFTIEEILKILNSEMDKLKPSAVLGILFFLNSNTKLKTIKLLGNNVINKLKQIPLDFIHWLKYSDDNTIEEKFNIFKELLFDFNISSISSLFTDNSSVIRRSKKNMEFAVKNFLLDYLEKLGAEFLQASHDGGRRLISSILLNKQTAENDYIIDMIKILGKDNVSLLWYEDIHYMFDEIFAKKGFRGQIELAELLKKYYSRPSNDANGARQSDYARIINLLRKFIVV